MAKGGRGSAESTTETSLRALLPVLPARTSWPAVACSRQHLGLSLLPRPRQRFARHRGIAHCTHSNTNSRPQSTRGKPKPLSCHMGPLRLSVRLINDESPAPLYRSLNSTALRVDKALAIYGTRVIRSLFTR